MIVFPAVDIKNGRCVRLLKGRPDTATQYDECPWRAARRWERAGASWLHVVDLDGALHRSTANDRAVSELLDNTTISVQMGGGIRSREDVDRRLAAGVRRVVIGTRAVDDPQWTMELCRALPDRIVVALDASDGCITTHGWQDRSEVRVEELAGMLEQGRPAAFLYTDVERDGMLSQPDFAGIERLLRCCDIPVIASGGVSSLDDIRALGACGADAVITGKALYEERFRLEDALEVASGFGSRMGGCGPVQEAGPRSV